MNILSVTSSQCSFANLFVSPMLSDNKTFRSTLDPVADKIRKIASNKIKINFYPEVIHFSDELNIGGVRVVVSRKQFDEKAILHDMRALVIPSGDKKSSKVLYKTIKHLVKRIK